METATKLSNIQLELLKLYANHVSDEDILAIKRLIALYFAEKAIQEADRLWGEKGWTQETMREWLSTKMRTRYNAQRNFLNENIEK